MKEPYFSIVMPLYNHAPYVGAAIESVIKQTFPDWELIICNDGSTDDSLNQILRFSDPRIKIINKTLNQGGVDALNSSLFLSNGRYICWLSSDDLYAEHKLEIHKRFHETYPESFVTIAPYGSINGGTIASLPQFIPSPSARLTAFLTDNYINGLSPCAARHVYARCGLFSAKYPHCADVHRWLTIFRTNTPLYIQGETASFTRFHTASQPDTPWGTAFEPVRMLYNELQRLGPAAFIPDLRSTQVQNCSSLPEGHCIDTVTALIDSQNLFSRWGLGSQVEKIISNWIRSAPNQIENLRVAMQEEPSENASKIEHFGNILQYAMQSEPCEILSIAEYALSMAKMSPDANLRAFFARYLRDTLT